MWIITTDGFYSVVQNRRDPAMLTVRARSLDDITKMAERLALYQFKADVQTTPERDYMYRLVAPRNVMGMVLMDSVDEINYDNFKLAVAERQGWAREMVYADVWSVLHSGLQKMGPIKTYRIPAESNPTFPSQELVDKIDQEFR